MNWLRARCKCAECVLDGNDINDSIPTGERADVLFVGEAPGKQEIQRKVPFIGKAGRELNRYLYYANIDRDRCAITNTTLCLPKGKTPTPTIQSIRACADDRLVELVHRVKPKVICTLGRISSQWFLGVEANMEQHHGIVFDVVHEWFGGDDLVDYDLVVVPVYHPAAPLHGASELMMAVAGDVNVVERELRGMTPVEDRRSVVNVGGHMLEDLEPDTTTVEIDSIAMADAFVNVELEHAQLHNKPCGIDTEWKPDNTPLFMSMSFRGDEAWVIDTTKTDIVKMIADGFKRFDIEWVMHNAPADVPVLDRLGFTRPTKPIHDTMILAHLLETEPKSLKPLTYRHRHYTMHSYESMISEVSNGFAVEYLKLVSASDLPAHTPVVVDGDKPRRVRSISSRVTTQLGKMERGTTTTDARKYWGNIDDDDPGKLIAIEALGVMPQADLSHVDRREAVKYSGQDAAATISIFALLREYVQDRRAMRAYDIDRDVIPSIVEMEREGMLIDIDYCVELGGFIEDEMVVELEHVERIAGVRFNPNSPPECLKYLKAIGLMSASAKSSDVKALKAMPPHVITEHIIAYRQLVKLRGTYVNNIKKLVGNDGRLRTRIRVTTTRTGRFSSADPNLQNIPNRTERGRRIRNAFVAKPEHTFVGADLSQIELRVGAIMSGDEGMLSAYRSGADIHTETAAAVFGVPASDVSKPQRSVAKTINFGALYGISAKGLFGAFIADGIDGYTQLDCLDFLDAWRNARPGVGRWIARMYEQAIERGFVFDMFGRPRSLPGFHSRHTQTVEESKRMAVNTPVQSSAASVLKLMMPGALEVAHEFDGRMLLQIHDELMFEVPKADAMAFGACIKGHMMGVIDNIQAFTIPCGVDVEIGDRWGDMKEVEV